MSDSERDDQGFPDGESGTPWGSPGGAIKRWLRRYRATDAEANSSTSTEPES